MDPCTAVDTGAILFLRNSMLYSWIPEHGGISTFVGCIVLASTWFVCNNIHTHSLISLTHERHKLTYK